MVIMVERLRAQVRHAIVANALAWVAVLGLVAVGLYLQDRRDAERQRDICGLITATDDAYLTTPPSTATGRAIAQATHAYRLRLHC